MALNPGPEIRVEQVAQALWQSDTGDLVPPGAIDHLWGRGVQRFPDDAAAYNRLATAALDALDARGVAAPRELPPLLDQLDQLRAAATPGPWAQNGADPAYIIGQVSEDGEEYLDVADAGASVRPGISGWRRAEADAALIVAAVNALPKLTAKLRAAEALWAEHHTAGVPVDPIRLRSALDAS